MSGFMASQHSPQPGNGSSRKETREYLLLTGGGLDWALPAAMVEEIFYLENLTPLPLVPAFIEGLTNLRGVALPLVNLATLVGGSKTASKGRDIRCVLLEGADLRLGLIVEDVQRIHRVPLASHREENAELSHCVLELGPRRVQVLDFDRLVSRVRGEIRRENILRGFLPDDDDQEPQERE